METYIKTKEGYIFKKVSSIIDDKVNWFNYCKKNFFAKLNDNFIYNYETIWSVSVKLVTTFKTKHAYVFDFSFTPKEEDIIAFIKKFVSTNKINYIGNLEEKKFYVEIEK